VRLPKAETVKTRQERLPKAKRCLKQDWSVFQKLKEI